jgi:hypothetical protein
MRKLGIVLVFMLIVSGVHAQEKSVSFVIGGNMSNVLKSGDFFENALPKPGLYAGVFRNVQSEGAINFNYGLVYSEKGFRSRFDYVPPLSENANGEAIYAYRYNYIGTPINIAWAMGEKHRVNPYFGMTPSRLIAAKMAYTLTNEGESQDYIRTTYSQANKWDLSCQIGVSFDFKSNDNLTSFAALQVSGSLFPVSNNAHFANEKLRHYALSFMLGIKL